MLRLFSPVSKTNQPGPSLISCFSEQVWGYSTCGGTWRERWGGSSASGPALAGQDALLPRAGCSPSPDGRVRAGRAALLCSQPCGAAEGGWGPSRDPTASGTRLVPAGLCWSQHCKLGLSASPGATRLGLGARTGVLSGPAAPQAAPGPYWMLAQGTRGRSWLRTSLCRRMRPPRSHPGPRAQGVRPQSVVMGAGLGEVLGLGGGPCAPPGEPDGGERWQEGTGGSAHHGGEQDSPTSDWGGEDGDGTEQRWGAWGCPGGSAPTPQLCVQLPVPPTRCSHAVPPPAPLGPSSSAAGAVIALLQRVAVSGTGAFSKACSLGGPHPPWASLSPRPAPELHEQEAGDPLPHFVPPPGTRTPPGPAVRGCSGSPAPRGAAAWARPAAASRGVEPGPSVCPAQRAAPSLASAPAAEAMTPSIQAAYGAMRV